MTKQEQKQVNEIIDKKINEFNATSKTLRSETRLRNCTAIVYEMVDDATGEIIYVLKSYDTVVALIYGNCIYDFLRLVYGYTATSASHIAKFTHDYIDMYYDETISYRYYPIVDYNNE